MGSLSTGKRCHLTVKTLFMDHYGSWTLHEVIILFYEINIFTNHMGSLVHTLSDGNRGRDKHALVEKGPETRQKNCLNKRAGK